MYLLTYRLLRTIHDICGDLIVEKLLCWDLEFLSMFGLNKNSVLEKLWMIICKVVAFHMHQDYVKENKNCWKVAWNGKKQKKNKMMMKSKSSRVAN